MIDVVGLFSSFEFGSGLEKSQTHQSKNKSKKNIPHTIKRNQTIEFDHQSADDAQPTVNQIEFVNTSTFTSSDWIQNFS
jgi:hypothetical protein